MNQNSPMPENAHAKNLKLHLSDYLSLLPENEPRDEEQL